MLDVLMQKDGGYTNYQEIIRDILFSGINSFIGKQ